MLQIAGAYAHLCPQLFSLEMWGGATFDTSMRFLKECPGTGWCSCARGFPTFCFRCCCGRPTPSATPTIPTTSCRRSSRRRPQAGIDVFRIFDALNWVPNMRVAMDAVTRRPRRSARRPSATPATSSIPTAPNTTSKYYVDLAKELENMGAHILAIKDMAGLCKPYAAEKLVKTLKGEIGIPIHFHTHDMSGVQAASILKAAEEGWTSPTPPWRPCRA